MSIDKRHLSLEPHGHVSSAGDVRRPPGRESVRSQERANDTWDRWNAYLASLAEPEGPLSPEHASHVQRFWRNLRASAHGPLQVPQAGPTDGPGFLLVWDRHRHHLEIEIFEDGNYDWFYRDRDSESYQGDEGLEASARARELLKHLRFFNNGAS
jgi:plasmid stabilization system protein ParE